MIVFETFGPLELLTLWRRPQRCRCGAVVVLRRSWGSRLARCVARGRVQVLSRSQMGRGQAIASFSSVGLTEAVFARGGIDPPIETALLRYFYQDEAIRLVVRKISSQWIEQQLAACHVALRRAKERKCLAVTFVPADRLFLQLLRCWQETQSTETADGIEVIVSQLDLWLGALRHTLASWLIGLGLVATVFRRLVCQGFNWRLPSRRTFRVAMHGHVGVSGHPHDMRSTDFLIDGHDLRREDLLVLLSGKGDDARHRRQYTEAGIAWVHLFGPPIPLPYLVRGLPRLLKAVWAFWMPTGAAHAALRRRAAGALLYGMALEALLHHYAIGALLNAEEHAYHHIVETVVLNRWGGRTMLIPYSMFTVAGSHPAYLHYDCLPLPGWFPVSHYGKTWSWQMIVKPIGILTNDGAGCPETTGARTPLRRILEEVRGRGQLVGAFTGSYTPDEFVMERNRRFLKILAALADREPRLWIVIKPKATRESPGHADFLLTEPFQAILDRGVNAGKIVVLNPYEGWTYSAQELIRSSDVVVSTGQFAAFGSVWVEALLLGKPSYVFSPAEFRAAPFAAELFDRWLFDEEETLLAAIRRALRDPTPCHVNGKLKEWFDPYNDGRAIERLRNAIITMTEAHHRRSDALRA